MSDDNTSFSISSVKVDKNKSAEQYIQDVENKYIIPPLIREKFADIVKLLFEAESMDNEEREYWLQIMAVMTEDQVVKLRDILVNEKTQLEALDSKYNQEMNRLSGGRPEIDRDAMKARLSKIREKESANRTEEEKEADKLLRELENL
jgi:hypothetical protein